MKIREIPNSETLPIEFDLHKLEKDGKLKSKLITFENGTGVRVYWSSKHESEPRDTKPNFGKGVDGN